MDVGQQNTEKAVRDESALNRKELGESLATNREELSKSVRDLTSNVEKKLESVRDKVEDKLEKIRKDNSIKLDEMRITVDEKLHDTLEKRLGESFGQVSKQLEKVHKGLGEMQALASNVGDLKKVLVNVKSRGAIGEVQLENILEQMLPPNLFSKGVNVKQGSSEQVDFAIHLPGSDGNNSQLLLPIDAKFPTEDYERLLDAYEQADSKGAKKAQKSLKSRIVQEAKTVAAKYINPPTTTPYAIIFLPTEGLFAEVIRIPGLIDLISREYNIHIAGPTTISLLIASLQIGFRTLAVGQKSVEVWETLGAVKTEFSKFGIMLDKAHKKIEQAGNSIEDVAKKSKTLQRKLRKVEELPPAEAKKLLASSKSDDSDD